MKKIDLVIYVLEQVKCFTIKLFYFIFLSFTLSKFWLLLMQEVYDRDLRVVQRYQSQNQN